MEPVGAAHAVGEAESCVEPFNLSVCRPCAWTGPCHYSVKRDVFDQFPNDVGLKKFQRISGNDLQV